MSSAGPDAGDDSAPEPRLAAPPLLATPESATLLAPPDDVTDVNPPLSVPVVSDSAWPVVLMTTSLTLSRPKLEPLKATLVAVPRLRPRILLLNPSVTSLDEAAAVEITGAVPPVVGKARLSVGGVSPVIAAKLADAPLPNSRWPSWSVSGPT